MPRTAQVNQQIREETAEKILEGAKKVFARKGMAAKMVEIAAEAGVSQGLAYHYFPSKEAIFIALVRETQQPAERLREAIRKMPGTPLERLGQMLSFMIERRLKFPELYQFLYQAMADDSLPQDLHAQMIRGGKVAREVMRQVIVEGQASGEIARDDPDKLVGALAACLDGLSRRMVPASSEEIRKETPDASIILRMLRSDPKAK